MALSLDRSEGRADTAAVPEKGKEEPEPDSAASITRRAGVVAAGTFASRALGFGRDVVFAAVFPKEATDLFFVAFTIPNALRVLLGEGAVSSAVVPVFSEVRAKEGEERARAYFAKLTFAMGLVLAIVSITGVLAAPALVAAYATGYLDDAARFADTVALTRWVFPYLFFIGLTALGMGGLNALRRFAVPAFAPALLNVAFIASAFTLVGPALWLGLPPVGALALGALIGGALQLLVQWPAQRSVGLLRKPSIDLRDPAVKKTFALLVPLLAGFGVYQINTMLGRSFATFLPAGSQSYLWYGQRVVEIPQGMFALAIAGAALPTLSDLRARGDLEKLRELFSHSLRLTLFLAIPASAILAVLAEPVIAVGFGRGAFGRDEVLGTARSLEWQAAGVWAIAAVRTVVPMFYAYNDTRTPVIASATNLVFFAGTALALMGPLDHVAIAIALSAAGAAQLAMLLALLRRKVGPLGLGAVAVSALKIAFASLAMCAAAWGVARFGAWERGGNDVFNIVVLALAIAAGGVAFLLAAALVRCRELRELYGAVRRRARR
jgi:putative peptidoglycan lipid II flippase